MPLYEYDHMLGWANVQRHAANEITLLCDQHHRERTAGLLPLDKVRDANADPFNLRSGVSKPYDLHFSGNVCEAYLGSNVFTFQRHGGSVLAVPIGVDGTVLLGFVLEEDHLLLQLKLFDEMNNPVLVVSNNQLIYSMSPWDIRLVGKNLVIRDAPRKVLVDIAFDPPGRIIINRGRFLFNGVQILVAPESLLLVNNAAVLAGCSMKNCRGGLIIGAPDIEGGAVFRLPNVRRYLGDEAAVARWAKESLGDS